MKRIMMLITMIITIFNFTFSIDMSTTIFDQRIDTGGYREIIFKNNDASPVRYKFTLKNGQKDRDMSKWAKVYPKVMTIPAYGEKVLKIFVQSPPNQKLGEYSMNLIVEPIEIPTIQSSNGKIKGNSTLKFIPIIELLGYIGEQDFTKNINLKDIKFMTKDNKIIFESILENKGNVGFNAGIKLIGKDDSILGGKWLGRISKNKTEKCKVIFNKLGEVKDIKKIIIYDAINFNTIKTIVL